MVIPVVVWGETIPLAVHQSSKTVWIARGDYKGKSYEATGSSARSAAGAWREQVSYATN